MARKVDWTKPGYARVSAYATGPTGMHRHPARVPPCDACGLSIKVGDRYHVGPRRKTTIHEKCRIRICADAKVKP